jgi:hypothetical protein
MAAARLILIGLILTLLLLVATTVRAAEVTLAWDPVAPAPEGYRIYLRIGDAAYDYSRPAWSGTATSCTISGLPTGRPIHFVARAFAGPNESGNSNEVVFRPVVPAMPRNPRLEE